MNQTDSNAPFCIWNRKTLAIVLRGNQSHLLSTAQHWSRYNPGSFLVVPEHQVMRCADCDLQERAFKCIGVLSDGAADFACDHCGWQQASTAHGAAELCLSATWHTPGAYARYRDVARSGGISVPDSAPNFEAST